MRFFVIGLLLLNIGYFFVPVSGEGGASGVLRGDSRVRLLSLLDEEGAGIKWADEVRSENDLAPPASKQAFAPSEAGGLGDGLSESSELVQASIGTPSVSSLPRTEAPVVEVASESQQTKQAQAGENVCFTIGPFRKEAKAEGLTSNMEKAGIAVDWRAAKERRTRGYSVYLPSYPSYEAAEEVVKKLAEHGVTDYFILTDAKKSNAISLGFFTIKSGSEKRVSELKRMGYSPQVEVRFDEVPVFWLDIEAEDKEIVDDFWRKTPKLAGQEILGRECR